MCVFGSPAIAPLDELSPDTEKCREHADLVDDRMYPDNRGSADGVDAAAQRETERVVALEAGERSVDDPGAGARRERSTFGRRMDLRADQNRARCIGGQGDRHVGVVADCKRHRLGTAVTRAQGARRDHCGNAEQRK